jgi:transposase
MTHIAMDVHKNRSTLAVLAPGMDEPQVIRCKTERASFEQALGHLPRPWVVAVESSRQSPAVMKWLRELAADELHLVNAQELSKYTKHHPKTDRRDALKMLQLLRQGELPECYLAPAEVQERRALSRGRQGLREISTKLRNTIRAVLAQQGINCSYSDLTGRSAQQELPRLVALLGPLTQGIIQQLIAVLEHVERALRHADAQVREATTDDPVAEALMEIEGIGPIVAFGLIAELGTIQRFPNPAHLISYAGLAPRAKDSDTHRGARHLPPLCNKRLRHFAVVGTQCVCRSRADSKPRRTYDRLRRRLKANTAKIAAARVLLTDIFYRWQRAVLSSSEAA